MRKAPFDDESNHFQFWGSTLSEFQEEYLTVDLSIMVNFRPKFLDRYFRKVVCIN